MFRKPKLLFAVALLLAPPFAFNALAALTPSQQLAKIADDYFEQRLSLFSLSATEDVGDPRFEGQLQIEIAPAHLAQRSALYKTTLSALRAVAPSSLTADEKLTAELLRYEAQLKLDGLAYPAHLLPVDHLDCVPIKLADWAGGQSVQPFKTVANYDNFLRRIDKLPQWVDQAIANMREGMRVGVTQSRSIIERVLPQLEELNIPDATKSAFYSPIARLPEAFSSADRIRLAANYQRVLAERVLPAQAKLVAFLKTEYLPKTRTTAGFGALPNGAAWYAHQVRDNTSTNLSPAAIHALGLKEVARIRNEMEAVKIQVGFKGTLNEFLRGIKSRNTLVPFKTEEEVIARFKAIDTSIAPKLAALFGRTPKAALDIRPVDKLTRDTASSSYILPAIDGSRPGVFYAAVADPLKFTSHDMTALFLHEGQPGHHFQMALQQELDVPRFRRFAWHNAYGEGWALYAESLGKEMGVYADPFTYLGRLQAELIRAVRLVTDTGLHDKNWTREETIAYMMKNQGVDEASARRATERYMVWVGQALGYKIGELKILELRAAAQQKLGDKFDIKSFHDAVLTAGSLPLTMLEERVNAWVAQVK
jgi:uncharacterized protein (DUF885 family)